MTHIITVLLLLSFQLFAIDVVIKPGSSAKSVSKQLKDKGVIKREKLFYLYLRANKLTGKIHTGTFHLKPNSSFNDIADIITGKKQQLVKITVPEGYTIDEIVTKLYDQGIISNKEAFFSYLSTQSPNAINSLLNSISIESYEGLFFPDTYYFSKNTSNQQVYSIFTKRLNSVFIPLYKAASNPKLSFYDTLILASIIEKEAGTQSEMPLISGVFHNRLRRKMALASCPTVGYAMGEPRKKSLSYADLKYKSPFNTYLHRGLPPTPIAAPGKKAFLAALNPSRTPYLYFVSKADGSGEHIFSRTLKDHLRHQKNILARNKK